MRQNIRTNLNRRKLCVDGAKQVISLFEMQFFTPFYSLFFIYFKCDKPRKEFQINAFLLIQFPDNISEYVQNGKVW